MMSSSKAMCIGYSNAGQPNSTGNIAMPGFTAPKLAWVRKHEPGVFAAVRTIWPSERPLGVRVSATDWVEGGWTPEETVLFSRELKALGCDFIDVTMGLWRLQEVMREIAARSPADLPSLNVPRSALFSPMPGDHHNFGTMMIEEVFSRAGWQSEALVKPDRRDLLDRLSQRPFNLVGLTLARDCPSETLSNLIKAMRSASANPNIAVLVGGRMINENPGMVQDVGADGTGVDALAALEMAEGLVKVSALNSQQRR